MALLPTAQYNDTYLYSISNSFCPRGFSAEKCLTYRGGLYNSEQSENNTQGATIRHANDGVNATWNTDKVVVKDSNNQNLDLGQVEFGIQANASNTSLIHRGELGMGMNSTFMNALSSQNKISSKSWSFFYGNDPSFSDSPRNGSFIVGGYDEALIAGPQRSTAKFKRGDSRCMAGMLIDVTGIALQSTGAGKQDILQGGEKLQMCLVTSISTNMFIHESYWQRMAKFMNVEPATNGSDEFFPSIQVIKPNATKFDGNLTVTINNELTITIPNKNFIFDEPTITTNGIIQRKKGTQTIAINKYSDADRFGPRLGGLFFSAAYLMVNHDKQEFTIAQAAEQPAQPKIVGIDSANTCTAPIDGGTKDNSKGPGDSSTPPDRGLTKGGIAGIVCSVIAALIIAIGAFLIRRRRKTAATKGAMDPEVPPGYAPVDTKYAHEVQSATPMHPIPQGVAEVDGGGYRDHYQAPIELDATVRPAEIGGHR